MPNYVQPTILIIPIVAVVVVVWGLFLLGGPLYRVWKQGK